MTEMTEIRKMLEEAMPVNEFGEWKKGQCLDEGEQPEELLELRAMPLDGGEGIWYGLHILDSENVIPKNLLISCCWYKGVVYLSSHNGFRHEKINEAIEHAESFADGFNEGLSHAEREIEKS